MSTKEPESLQVAEATTKTPRKTPAPAYVMPGLCNKIADAFRAKANRGVIPTAGTIADNLKVHQGIVSAALIYQLYKELDDLRKIVGWRRAA